MSLNLKGLLKNNPEKAITEGIEKTASESGQFHAGLLAYLIETEKALSISATKPIVFAPPLIHLNAVPIIRQGTINCIQGKMGSHKSRLSELLSSLLLAGTNAVQFLGFEKQEGIPITVCYIDTERNVKEEFPVSIQSIRNKAGITNTTVNFRFTSLKKIPRKQRLKALSSFLSSVKKTTQNPLFVVLDVTTDCIGNFNDPVESMALMDYLGNLTEQYGVTFLLIIHENPFSDKMRGHLGSEGSNKSSTVMGVGFVKNKKNEDTELIELKFIKLRTAKKPKSIFLKYDDFAKGLILASQADINQINAQKREVAQIDDVANVLGDFLKPSLSQKSLLDELKKHFNCSENTLKERLQEIANQQLEVTNENLRPCTLHIKSANGKATFYELQEIDYEVVEL